MKNVDVLAAIQAAALADNYGLANEIATRHKLDVCRRCARKLELEADRGVKAFIAVFEGFGGFVEVCIDCHTAIATKQEPLETVVLGPVFYARHNIKQH
jgi:hypothetical protein